MHAHAHSSLIKHWNSRRNIKMLQNCLSNIKLYALITSKLTRDETRVGKMRRATEMNEAMRHPRDGFYLYPCP